MRYLIGLLIGIVLMAAWPQETRLVFGNALEYVELGIDKVRQQMGSEEEPHAQLNPELMIGTLLIVGTSGASFMPTSVLWGMANRDDYMPQAYSKIDKNYLHYPSNLSQQYIQPYTGHAITLPIRQKRYVSGKTKISNNIDRHIENE